MVQGDTITLSIFFIPKNVHAFLQKVLVPLEIQIGLFQSGKKEIVRER